MKRTMIPVEESFRVWREDPEYVKAYDALEDEFSLATAMNRMLETLEGEQTTMREEIEEIERELARLHRAGNASFDDLIEVRERLARFAQVEVGR